MMNALRGWPLLLRWGLLAGLLLGLGGPPRPITVFLAGDSTMAEKRADRRPETGWGEALPAFFDTTQVRVENHARNGRSTRTFIEEGRWQALIERVQPGDYVFIQFGHNDQSEAKPDRYTPPEAFRGNLIRFVRDVRARGGEPVLVTPVVRRRFDAEGRFYDVHGVYPDLVRSVAVTYGVPLVDLHRASAGLLRELGPEGSKRLFLHLKPGAHPNYPDGLEDDTHFSPAGARAMAERVVQEVRALGLPLAAHLRTPPPSPPLHDAVVDARHAGPPGAFVDGVPVYATLGDALAAVPVDNDRPFVIFIRTGQYREKLTIDRPHVHLVGAQRDATVLTFDASADTPAPGGGTYGTEGSFTLRVTAPGFRAANLTIENAFDYPANAALPDDDPARVRNPQAVALMTAGDSDRAVFEDCVITGYQDTLFHDAGRAYFHRCRIEGHVDFIFGAGQAVFEDCDIVSRNRPGKDPTGYVTAPSTPVAYPYGFLFLRSRFLKASPDVPPASVRLGRPWHPSADPHVNGSAVFIGCFMDDHLGPDGYAPISSRNAEGERIWFDLEPGSRFFEYGSYGPGAVTGPRRPALTGAAAAWYTPRQVLGGWDPAGD